MMALLYLVSECLHFFCLHTIHLCLYFWWLQKQVQCLHSSSTRERLLLLLTRWGRKTAWSPSHSQRPCQLSAFHTTTITTGSRRALMLLISCLMTSLVWLSTEASGSFTLATQGVSPSLRVLHGPWLLMNCMTCRSSHNAVFVLLTRKPVPSSRPRHCRLELASCIIQHFVRRRGYSHRAEKALASLTF